MRPQIVEAELAFVDGAFVRNARVHVDEHGVIARVEHSSEGLGTNEVADHRRVAGALIPGFVNCHSHAFQRGLRGVGETFPEPGSFWVWRDRMYALVEGMTPASLLALSRQCFAEMRASGITTVGEFHYLHHSAPGGHQHQHQHQHHHHHQHQHHHLHQHHHEERFDLDKVVLQAAAEVGIRIVLLVSAYIQGSVSGDALALAQLRFQTSSLEEYWAHLDSLQETLPAPELQSVGVVAHSIRAVSLDWLISLHQGAVARKLPFHMHVEEQAKEVDDCVKFYGKAPMRLILDNLDVGPSFTAVHCNHTAANDMEEFVSRGGIVCACPLTEAALGDGTPHLAQFRDRIVLGSDCNARIDMVEEMRWLEYVHRLHTRTRGAALVGLPEYHPDLPRQLLEYATGLGGVSLMQKVGKIEAGFFADFAVVDLEHPSLRGWTQDSLLASLIFGTCASSSVITETCINGLWRSSEDVLRVAAPGNPVKEPTQSPPGGADVEFVVDGKLTAHAAEQIASCESVVDLAIALIKVRSLSAFEQPMADALEAWLLPRGWTCTRQEIGPQAGSGGKPRWNVLFRPKQSDSSVSPRIILNTHMDTVPPYIPPSIKDGKIWGRGACDTKSIIASYLFAAQRLLNEGHADDLGLLFVVSEETDHTGMTEANKLNLDPEYMIVGEPTESKLISRQKGILKARLVSRGVAAHSGYPHLGVSAIDKLVEVLADLQKVPWPKDPVMGDTTLNVGIISGGQAVNAVPEYAEALIMFRVITPPAEILEQMAAVVQGRVEIEPTTANPPVDLTIVPGFETGIVAFNTDIPYFKFSAKGHALLYGPGSILHAHSVHEQMDVEELKGSVDVYVSLVKSL